jgi:magnesium chelatase family protein
MNPCPCGYLGDKGGRCRCSPDQVLRYRGRLSGPLLDRIDLHIEVPALPAADLQKGKAGESSGEVRARVLSARQRQLARQGSLNQALVTKTLEAVCALDAKSHEFLEGAMVKLRLSARAFHRVLRVARTIADLEGSEGVSLAHLSEALGYRILDRQVTG